MLVERVLSALIIGPVMILSFFFGGVFFAVVVGILAIVSAAEYRSLLKNIDLEVDAIFVPVSTLVALSGYLGYFSFFVAALALGAIVLLSFSLRKGAPSALYGLAGQMYVGGFLGTLCLVRRGPDGQRWSLFILFITWATDIGAYIGGKIFGKHKLAPSISPGKSWEGAISGLLTACLVAGFLGETLELSLGFSLLTGVILGILGQLGDLVESLFKRYCRVKDSGKAIPGHGGFLDRFDSLLFTSAGGLLMRSIYMMVFH